MHYLKSVAGFGLEFNTLTPVIFTFTVMVMATDSVIIFQGLNWSKKYPSSVSHTVDIKLVTWETIWKKSEHKKVLGDLIQAKFWLIYFSSLKSHLIT